MRNLVLNSAKEGQWGDHLPLTPFMLDLDSTQQATEFEIIFVAGGVRYQYGFASNSQQVLEEWLYAYPKGRLQRWYGRRFNINQYEWQMGSSFTGQKQTWQDSTRPNALFLSTAVQLNSEQLKPIYDWFRNTLNLRGLKNSGDNSRSIELCTDDASRHHVVNFLQNADIAIQNIAVEQQDIDSSFLPSDMPQELKDKIIQDLGDHKLLKIRFLHPTDQNKGVYFDLQEESDGTQKLFAFAGLWLDSLAKGQVVVVDELHDNLHPKLVEYLVRLFHSEKTNSHNAQLIFTTHETSILNQDIFRRDQIWFCERDKQQSTILYPLTDFSPRKNRENLEASYLAGRYGALPFLREPDALRSE
jgi:hypothetical protein